MTPSSLESALPLTPLQEGMLFHALYEDDGIDVYTVQVSFGLDGPLAPDVLRASAEEVLRRHTALRAGFQTLKSGKPVQLVRRAVRLPWHELDLRGLPPAEQRERLGRYQAEDRARGFDMARPPLLRIALAALADDRHVMVVTFHHIVLDSWSLQLVLRDLFTLYERHADPAALPPAVPFGGYPAWLAGQDRRVAEDAWSAALADLPEPTLIARGAPEPGPSAMPRLACADLPPRTAAALTAAARAAGLTLNTVVQGLWALLLSGVTGRHDVVFGQTVSGRPPELDGVEDIVGLLINAVPVRVRLDPNEPLAALLARVQREQTDLVPHHHVGLADIQRRAGLGELYDTSVSFGNAPRRWEAVGDPSDGLRVTVLEEREAEATGSTHYPLSLTVAPGDGLRLALSYRGDLFDATDADRVLDRLRALIDTYLTAPGTLVGRIEALPEREWTRIVRRWNDTGRPVPDTTLPELFRAQAARTPAATALVYEGRTLTYAGLAARVDALTDVLVAHGVRAGDFVAVAVPRSMELVVALHAVVAAGAAYVPVDPDYPADRIDRILTDSAPALLLTTTAVRDKLPATSVPRLLLDCPLPPAPRVRLPRRVPPGSPAYVMFTSGSTGRPKGVVVPHSAITNTLLWMQDQYPLGPDDRVLQKTPSGFDVSVPEFFWPLQTGATLVVAAPGGHKDAAYLVDLIRRESVTTAQFVPSMLQVFLQEPGVPECVSLRQVTVIGEALPPETQNAFHARLPGAALHNLYGPTEAAVQVTAWTTAPDEDAVTVPIGKPVWNTRVYVLDPALRPIPPGVPGELYLSGRQLADGYVRRPTLTAERFVADPFDADGGRMYRTGDVVRWSPDGDLEYLGRADDQVKVRGHRVELGEIETVLSRHPAVAQAAVAVREDQPGVRRLVGYVVPAGRPAAPDELLRHAAEALPDYMVPAALVELAELPLTPNGKLDRKALPAPAAPRATGGRPPRGPVEEVLGEQAAAVLGLPGVGADDSFFDLGGDSILSIQLVARARRAGLVITPKDVFQHRTVAALARVARRERAAEAEPARAGVGELPATPIAHWLRGHHGPDHDFHQATVVRVPPDLGLDRLTGAVRALLDRHDALRMRRVVRSDARGWTFDVAPPGVPAAWDCVRRVDAAGLDEAGLRAAVTAQTARARAELAPDERQMIRVVWLDAGPGRSGRLLLVIHHLAVDAVSWRVLLPDLRTAWEAAADGGGPELAPVPTSPRTWAHRLTQAATDPARVAELPLWTAAFADAGATGLVRRALDPARDTYGTARTLSFRVPPEVTETLVTAVPAAYRAGVEEVLLSALAVAVGAWRRERGRGTGAVPGEGGADREETTPSPGDSGAVLVDVEGHGRRDIGGGHDLSRTVGWFTTLHPVRLDPGPAGPRRPDPGDPAPDRALKRVKEQLRAVPDHGIGYGLLRHLNPATAPLLADLPTPQIGFNYLGRLGADTGQDWQEAAESDATGAAAHPGLSMPHLLELAACVEDSPRGPALTGSWTWPGAALTEADVRALDGHWQAALRALAAHAARPGAGGLTPSDVRPARVDQRELERLESRWAPDGLDDVLPLTPLQEGLLFHARYDRDAPDVYHVQQVVELAGPLDARPLRAACQALVDRHPALRAAFTLTRDGVPVQVVPRRATVPWREIDLAGPDADERLTAFLAEDRLRRFDPERPPLLRCTLLHLPGQRHALVLTHHHLLTDGWSISLVLRDFLHLWAHAGDGSALPAPVPVRPYHAWLAAQDPAAARAAWRAALDGLAGPTLLCPGADAAALPGLPRRITAELPRHLTEAVAGRARGLGLTLNTVLQGAWGLLLADLTGRRDVVFGTTVSVRPPELPGVEEMVGLHISTVPVRVDLTGGGTLAALLAGMQDRAADLAPHAHLGPAAIQRLAGHGPLYDTSTVFENFPRAAERPRLPGDGPRITGFHGRDAYHYPLKLLAEPGERLYLEVSHRPELVTADRATAVLRRLTELLTTFAATPDAPIADLLGPAGPAGVPDQPRTTSPPRRTDVTSPQAEVIGALAASVLGLERLDPYADFFAAGGDSLLALRLAGRIGEVFGRTVDVREVFRHRTPAALAAGLPTKASAVP